MLSYYNTSTGAVSTDFFAKANNGTGLGDTGNDMMIYGSKLYIVVHGSSVLTIADKLTGQKVKNIDFLTPGGAKSQPRYVVAYKNKVLVDAYDGTVSVIDTASMAIEKSIPVGNNPEQMVVLGDKLYVANSGGMQTIKDSTISVISLSSMTEVQKIKTGTSPSWMTADESGNLYVICSGDYLTGLKPKLAKISTSTNTMVKIADTITGRIQYYNGALYATGGYYGSMFVRKLSTTDFKQETANFVTDGTSITTAYGINVDPANGDVYVTDAKDYTTSGEVFCFDKTGKKKFSFSTTPAVNPGTVVFIK
jgi:YVTN family beta-propeller protein